MLNSIYIDGFKNLRNLKLDLKPGLNVLIGPNGVGKSNILGACAFISHILDDRLNNLPRYIGGVKKVSELFNIKNEFSLISGRQPTLSDIGESERIIHIILKGTNTTPCFDISKLNEEQIPDRIVDLSTSYEFECKIGLDELRSEPLSYFYQKAFFEFSVDGKQVDTLNVEFTGPYCKIDGQNQNFIERVIDKDINPKLKSLEINPEPLKFNALLQELGERFYPFRNVIREIQFGTVFEIMPLTIRYDRNELYNKGVAPDGSGLFSTLAYIFSVDRKIFNDLVEEFKIISSNLIGIDVEINSPKNDIDIRVNLKQENSITSIPIHLVSDGLLKWFSIVTAIVLTNKNFIVDEPENFLDTAMQSEFSTFLRDEFEDKSQFCLITTHSETLVNSLKPEEVIMVNSTSDFVEVRRISQIDRLKTNIKRSGFPLGWYYHTGSLELYCD